MSWVKRPKGNLPKPNIYTCLGEISSMSEEIKDQMPPWVQTFKKLNREVKKNSK